MNAERVRGQLEGAIQVTTFGVVVTVAFVASHIQPWNFPELRALRTFVLVELAALAAAYVVATRARLRALPGALVAFAFAGVGLLSAAWSVDPWLTLERGGGFAVLIVAAGALGLATANRPRFAGVVMLAFLAATVFVALAGLFELWHARDQAILPATKGQGARYNGIGQNPNQVAMLIAITLPFALWAVAETRGRARGAAAAAALLLVASLIASGSRGAVIAGFAGCLAYLVAIARRRRLAVAGAVALAFVVAIGITQLPQPAKTNPPLYETFGQTPKLSPQDLNSALPLESEFGFPGENVETGARRTLFFSSGRVEAWRFAFDQALRRPLAGYGFGTEDEAFVDRTYLFVSDVVENSYLGVLLQVGLVGLTLLLLALAAPLAAWLRRRPVAGGDAAACAGAVVAGVALAAPQSYVTSVGSPPTAPFWIALFLLTGLVYARRSA